MPRSDRLPTKSTNGAPRRRDPYARGGVAPPALRAQMHANLFGTDRRLGLLKKVYGRRFVDYLESLPPGARWVDIGPGRAFAVTDWLRERPDVHATGISPRHPDPQLLAAQRAELAPRFTYLERAVETVIPEDMGGRAHLGTDNFGAMSYSPPFDETLRASLGLLEPGALHFMHLCQMGVRTKDDGFPHVPNHPPALDTNGIRSKRLDVDGSTLIFDADGRRISLWDFFSAIEGANVVEMGRAHHDGRLKEASGTPVNLLVCLEKTADEVKVPELKVRTVSNIEPKRPPTRVLQVVDGTKMPSELTFGEARKWGIVEAPPRPDDVRKMLKDVERLKPSNSFTTRRAVHASRAEFQAYKNVAELARRAAQSAGLPQHVERAEKHLQHADEELFVISEFLGRHLRSEAGYLRQIEQAETQQQRQLLGRALENYRRDKAANGRA